MRDVETRRTRIRLFANVFALVFRQRSRKYSLLTRSFDGPNIFPGELRTLYEIFLIHEISS